MQGFGEECVRSADGTMVGYRQLGSGSGLVLVEGAMGTAVNYEQLARALASRFTVYVPDRRGRGMSPKPYSPAHRIERDIEDIGALVDRTDARFVFGLSSGAIIALAATAALPAIQKAVLYEPPFYRDGISHKLIARFNSEVGDGKLPSALVTARKIVKLGPPVTSLLPRPLLELLARAILRRDARSAGKYEPLSNLIPAMRYDFNVVGGYDGKAENFAGLSKPVLLLGGSKSSTYLKEALLDLDALLPASRRVEIRGLDHSGPWNDDRGGNPDPIVQEMVSFFAGAPTSRADP